MDNSCAQFLDSGISLLKENCLGPRGHDHDREIEDDGAMNLILELTIRWMRLFLESQKLGLSYGHNGSHQLSIRCGLVCT